MKKIIKPGRLTEYFFICRACGCEFTATVDECQLLEIGDMEILGETHSQYKTECPCCENICLDGDI